MFKMIPASSKGSLIFLTIIFFITSFKAYCYDGPLFDAMAQIDETVNMKQAIKDVRNASISKIALFARSRKFLGENEKKLIKLQKKNKDLIILGAPKYFLHKKDISKKFTNHTLANVDKYNYAFIGEILFTHADKDHGRQHASGETYLDPSGEGHLNFLKSISRKKIPVMIHWEFYNWDRDFPKFSKIFSQFPEVTFIIPHMGFGSINQIDTILSSHPNVYMTISKSLKKNTSVSKEISLKIGEGMVENKVLKPDWKNLLVKYQNRLMFATDAHKKHSWKKYNKKVRHARKRVLRFLPNDVAEKIAYKNAEKIYGIKLK